MDLFFCKRKLKNEGKKWVITTINDLILSLYKIKTLKQLNINFCNSFRKVLTLMYSWVNYINKKYVIRIVWNETLRTVLCHIHFVIYVKLSFFQKSTKVISGPIFIKFSPLKFKFNIVSYSNFEIILQFLNNSKLNSKFKFLCSNLT